MSLKGQRNYETTWHGKRYSGTYTYQQDADGDKEEIFVDSIFDENGDSAWDDELAGDLANRIQGLATDDGLEVEYDEEEEDD